MIWCSKEPKAVETAEIVAHALGVPTRIADGLEEHHRSNARFFPSRVEFEAAIARFFREPDRLVFGTETAKQALDRFSSAIDGVVEEDPADSVVVTHGTVLTLYAASLAQVPPMHIWLRLGMPCFVVVTLPDRRILSVVENVTGSRTPR